MSKKVEPIHKGSIMIAFALIIGWVFWVASLNPVNIYWNFIVTYGGGLFVIVNFLWVWKWALQRGIK